MDKPSQAGPRQRYEVAENGFSSSFTGSDNTDLSSEESSDEWNQSEMEHFISLSRNFTSLPTSSSDNSDDENVAFKDSPAKLFLLSQPFQYGQKLCKSIKQEPADESTSEEPEEPKSTNSMKLSKPSTSKALDLEAKPSFSGSPKPHSPLIQAQPSTSKASAQEPRSKSKAFFSSTRSSHQLPTRSSDRIKAEKASNVPPLKAAIGHICKVVQCQQKFKNRSSMLLHFDAHNDLNRIYVCFICTSRFYTLAMLKGHWSKFHKDVKYGPPKETYTCDVCEKQFDHQRKFINHMLNHKDESKKFICKLCQMRFKTEMRMKCHCSVTHPRAPKV